MSQLNKYQLAAVNNYGQGDYSHLATSESAMRESESVGDTLFTFIMRDLADDGEPMSFEIASQRLEQAQRDLQTVIDSFKKD